MPDQLIGFVRRWTVSNTIALVVGYLLYTPLGHGITGGHERELSSSQLIAHCVALAVVGLLVAMAQRLALAPIVKIPTSRLFVTPIAFIVLFWVGYYQPFLGELDWDILLGYLALGSVAWIGLVPARGHRLAYIFAILSFPIASFVGELILFSVVIALGARPEFSVNHLHHMIFWLTVGTTTGLLGGYLSGLCLRRILRSGRPHDLQASDA